MDRLNELIKQMQVQLEKWVEKKETGQLSFIINMSQGGIGNLKIKEEKEVPLGKQIFG